MPAIVVSGFDHARIARKQAFEIAASTSSIDRHRSRAKEAQDASRGRLSREFDSPARRIARSQATEAEIFRLTKL
jgi:hypothetical protein